MSDIVFVLIHSPLVGPLTWKLVADELRGRGNEAVVPILTSAVGAGPAYWQRHRDEVARDLSSLPQVDELILVGHSGAGALLPAIGASLEQEIVAYAFADAGIPEDSKSRFDLFGDEVQVAALQARAKNGLLPPWNQWFPDAALEQLLPDRVKREKFVAELLPTPLAVYEEPIPVPGTWPDAPCLYLQLSAAYDAEAEKARQLGWPVVNLEAGHLHMLVDPPAIAEALLSLVAQARDPRG